MLVAQCEVVRTDELHTLYDIADNGLAENTKFPDHEQIGTQLD